MKDLLRVTLFISTLISINSFAVSDCLRFMSNGDRAKIELKKNCSLILEDSGHVEVASIDACFSKISNQFKGKTSWGLVADIQKQSGMVRNDVMMVNTTMYKETAKEVIMDISSASPELLTRYNHQLIYNKETEQLSVKKNQGLFGMSNVYELKLQCQ